MSDQNTELYRAVESGDVSEVLRLLQLGADVNYKNVDDRQKAPLHYAARNGNLEVAKLLLSYSAHVEATSDYGWTPLHYAVDNGHTKVAELLLENKANTEAADDDKDQWTPLHYTAIKGYFEAAALLLSYRANTEAASKDGLTPLHFAVSNGQLEVARLLLSNEANAEAADKNGWTPLHYAAANGQLELAKLLWSYGAHYEAKDNEGSTPLHFAACSGFNEVLNYFSSNGANVGAANINKWTPRHGAARDANLELVKTFEDLWKMAREPLLHSDSNKIRDVMANKVDPVALSKEYIEHISQDKHEIGKGAYGVVFKVEDSRLKCVFALKQIVWPIPDSETRAFTENCFKTEIAALSRTQHPNIIRLFGFFLDNNRGKHSLLFEYAEYGSLASQLDSIESRKMLFGRLRLHILHDIIRALHYLHSGAGRKDGSSFYHRDLKSANICLTKSLTGKLIDCGLGKLVDEKSCSAESFINSSGSGVFGTNGYVCPWYAITREPFEPACDVYSFGVVMMEMITGVRQKGRLGDFYSRYIEKDQDDIKDGEKMLASDSDHVAGWEDDDVVEKLAQLAVQCCKKKKDRPKTEDLIDQICCLIHCDELGDEKGNALNSSIGPKTAAICELCSRHVCVIACDNGHGLCGACIDIHMQRNHHIPKICCPFVNCFCPPYPNEAIQQAVSKDIRDAHERQTKNQGRRIERALVSLTANIIAPCPALIAITFPGKTKFQSLKEWMGSFGRKTAHLHLFCQHSYKALETPIVLKVTRDWVRQIAPALKLAVILLRVAITLYGIPVRPLFPAMESLDFQTMLEEKAAALLDAMDNQINNVDRKMNESEILEALNQSSQTVEEVTGSAYHMLWAKLKKDKWAWWKQELTPVADPAGRTIYVKTKYLHKYY